jgi:uncharacterized protein (TIGR04255 family)
VSQRLPAHLPNKPLIEAIIEIRWGKEGQPDPAYPIIVGRLFERIKADYPVIEDLPIVRVPAEITLQQVRHRFRRAKDAWPLVQIGPGILTVNDTDGYNWKDFSARVRDILPHFFAVHPSPSTLAFNSLLLRYINAIDFDYSSQNILPFLADKMRVLLSLEQSILTETGVNPAPRNLALQLVFPVSAPSGALILLLGTGKHKNNNAVVWEIHFRSTEADLPTLPDGFTTWLDAAHAKIETWFFEMVKGPLLVEFAKQ